MIVFAIRPISFRNASFLRVRVLLDGLRRLLDVLRLGVAPDHRAEQFANLRVLFRRFLSGAGRAGVFRIHRRRSGRPTFGALPPATFTTSSRIFGRSACRLGCTRAKFAVTLLSLPTRIVSITVRFSP